MWEKVLWSDDCNIRLRAATPMYIHRPTGSQYSEKFCDKTVKNARYWMIWDSLSASGRGNLYFLPQNTTMNGTQYLSVLGERLKPMMCTCNCTMFMHDGAPCHTSRRVKSWLENKGPRALAGTKPRFQPNQKFMAHSQNEGIQGEVNDAGPTVENNITCVVHPNLTFCLQGLGAFHA